MSLFYFTGPVPGLHNPIYIDVIKTFDNHTDSSFPELPLSSLDFNKFNIYYIFTQIEIPKASFSCRKNRVC